MTALPFLITQTSKYIMKTLVKHQEEAMNRLIKEKNLRDLGKMFGDANEGVQCEWIENHCSFTSVPRTDFNDDPDASGFDLISPDGVKMKTQSKIRATDIHLATTRRKSKKNLGDVSIDGHVSYSSGEFDVLLISRPLGNKATRNDSYPCTARPIEEYPNVETWEMIAIPEVELHDHKRPGYLFNNVPKGIWGQYVGRASEVLEEVYESISNRR